MVGGGYFLHLIWCCGQIWTVRAFKADGIFVLFRYLKWRRVMS